MSQQINLLNPAFVEKKAILSSANLLQGLAAVLACLLVFYAYSAYRTRGMVGQAKEASRLQAEKQAQLLGLSAAYKPRQKDPVLAGEIEKIEKELGARDEALAILKGGGLENIRGYSGYMKAFARQIVPGLWLTGFSIRGREVALQGKTLRADLVPIYINRLDHEEVMNGTTFASLEMQVPKDKSANYLEFSLQANEAAK